MNKYDSELVTGILGKVGYRFVERDDEADIILINTCGVREHAENRALSDIDRLLARKKKIPDLIVGMIGCLSAFIGEELLDDRPTLDFAIGPDSYRKLPWILDHSRSETDLTEPGADQIQDETYGDIVPVRLPGVRAWVAVSRGCDNECAYCMVPKARGTLRSRTVEEILGEIKTLVDEGFPEVILLGQNVNAYQSDGTGFGGLLRQVSQVSGLKRVRFLTSHPKDLNEDLIAAMAEGGKICPDLHLPVQSGSDKILRAMKRGYTPEHYLDLIRKIREAVEDIAFSTDAIVGFPGETEQDFRDTVSLFEEVGFASAFVFCYSPRQGTPAFDWEDNIPAAVKSERLILLNETIKKSRDKLHKSMIGKKLAVSIEGFSRKYSDQVTGRSRQGYVVALPDTGLQSGDEVEALIEGVRGFTLLGKTG